MTNEEVGDRLSEPLGVILQQIGPDGQYVNVEI